jgi:hypothetical protein
MKVQTHLSLFLKEYIQNWKYVDMIIFLVILLFFVGFSDPCDRCAVDFGQGQMSCKDAFLNKIGLEENDKGVVVPLKPLNLTNKTIEIIDYSKP